MITDVHLRGPANLAGTLSVFPILTGTIIWQFPTTPHESASMQTVLPAERAVGHMDIGETRRITLASRQRCSADPRRRQPCGGDG